MAGETQTTMTWLLEIRDVANLDVPKRDFVAVVLEADVAFRGFRESGELAEFRLCDLLVPIIGTDFIFDVFRAVHGVLALVSAGGGFLALQDEVIPLTDGLRR